MTQDLARPPYNNNGHHNDNGGPDFDGTDENGGRRDMTGDEEHHRDMTTTTVKTGRGTTLGTHGGPTAKVTPEDKAAMKRRTGTGVAHDHAQGSRTLSCVLREGVLFLCNWVHSSSLMTGNYRG